MHVKKVCEIGIIALILSALTFTPNVFALTNKEKLELLEEKYLKGEIPTELYMELREKYTGKSKESKKGTLAAGIVFTGNFESDIPNWITLQGFNPDQCANNCYDWVSSGVIWLDKAYYISSGAKYEGDDAAGLKMGIVEGGAGESKRHGG